ncbi:MAG: DUF2244 domain-containing protein [Alphaproteobacteria bacterium]|nr:DUF2244 domain-containing protein [Alphaproteobacteria bacterium]
MSGATEPVFLDAVLRPNPPMNPRALRLILALVAGINAAIAVGFVLRGAWPIAPFLGADVALLAWAFHASRLAARAYERVKVTASELFVAYHPARGAPRETLLNPYWVSIELEQPEDMPRGLTLRSHGKILAVGNFLGPRERLSFANALKAALQCARSWRPA